MFRFSTHRLWQSLWQSSLNRKLPPEDATRFSWRNIFIFPTVFGGLWLGLVLVLWLTGINYQNGLILGLSFLLFALWWAALHQTHTQLSGLQLQWLANEPGQALKMQRVLLRLQSPKTHLGLNLEWEQDHQHLHLQSGQVLTLAMHLSLPRRGRHPLPRLKISTEQPYGLFRAWTLPQLAQPILVWPQALERPAVRQGSPGAASSAVMRPTHEPEQLAGLMQAQPSEHRQRILWPRYLRTGQLLVRHYEEGRDQGRTLSWQDYPHLAPELRLSALCADVIHCWQQQQAFGLAIPGLSLPIAQGQQHAHRALEALAVYESH